MTPAVRLAEPMYAALTWTYWVVWGGMATNP
jgi:hypothetical protein